MAYEDLLKLIGDLKDLGTKIVALFGGEALLREDVFDLVAEMKRGGFYVVLDTNGYLLPELYDRILASGVDMLVVSVDSSRGEIHDFLRGRKGSFQRTLEGLRKIQSRNSKITVVINTLIVRHNYQELVEVVRMGRKFGVKHFRFLAYNFIYPYDIRGMQSRELVLDHNEIQALRGEIEKVIAYCKAHRITLNSRQFLREIPSFYMKQNKKISCWAGYASIHIHNNGKVSFCSSLDSNLGNIRRKSFAEIWRSVEFLEERRKVMSPPCDKCWVSCYIEQNHFFSPRHLIKEVFNQN